MIFTERTGRTRVRGLTDWHDFHASAAVTDEAASRVEQGLATDAELLLLARAQGTVYDKVQKRAAGSDPHLQRRALVFVPTAIPVGVMDPGICLGFSAQAQNLQHRPRCMRQVTELVLLPVPVRGQLGQAAVAGFALAQLCRAFLYGQLQRVVVDFKLAVQKSNFQHVVNARLDL